MVLWANISSLGIHGFTSLFGWVFWFCIVNTVPSEGRTETELRHTSLTHLSIQSHLDLFCRRCFLDKHWIEHLMGVCFRLPPGHRDELGAVLNFSIRDRGMGPWKDNCDILLSAGMQWWLHEGLVVEDVTPDWFEENIRKQKSYLSTFEALHTF